MQPITTSSISPPGTPARSSAALTAVAPSSWAGTSLNAPPKLPIGVLAPSTTTIGSTEFMTCLSGCTAGRQRRSAGPVSTSKGAAPVGAAPFEESHRDDDVFEVIFPHFVGLEAGGNRPVVACEACDRHRDQVPAFTEGGVVERPVASVEGQEEHGHQQRDEPG